MNPPAIANRPDPSNVEALEWLFPERKRLSETDGARGDDRYLTTSADPARLAALDLSHPMS